MSLGDRQLPAQNRIETGKAALKGCTRIEMKDTRKSVAGFWERHYSRGEGTDDVVSQEEAYTLYMGDHNSNRIGVNDFHKISCELGIKVKRTKSSKAYHLVPISKESKDIHQRGVKSSIHFYLSNIQNLVTQDKNKSSFLDTMTKSKEDRRIIAITETGLKEGKHTDAEIKKYFPGHHFIRQDRKEKKGDEEAEQDPDHLSKSGGFVLLSSSGIPLEVVEKTSNGNVELIIAEARTIGISIILLYNPPSNFALHKFKEVLGTINTYLDSNKKRSEPMG